MKLTTNFFKNEFDSSDGMPMPSSVLRNIKELAENLQFLRNYTGRSVKINSGYRSPRHNMRIGGVRNSQHVRGKAADIVVDGLLPSETYSLISTLIKNGKMRQGGLGRYNSFTHYDIRGRKARWDKTT